MILAFSFIGCEKDKDEKDQIPTQGLVVYYPFNRNANDESGNGHHGTIIGATLTTDRLGNENSAYAFDGNNYISIANTTMLKTNVISITAWIKIESLAYDWMDIVSYGSEGHVLAVDEFGHVIGGIQFSGEICEFEGSTNVATEEWFLITLTRNSYHNIKLYVNGSEETSNTCGMTEPKYDFDINIGRDPYGGEHFNGSIDEVRIYNRALTTAEIRTLYNLEK